MKDQRDVSPLSREVLLRWAHPLSTPLQDGLRFVPPPMPARPWAHLTARFPSREAYGVALFRLSNSRGVRRALSTESRGAPDQARKTPCADSVAVLAQALQHFWLVLLHDVSQACTWVRPITSPSPISVAVLTDTSLPRGSDASRWTVGTLSEGSVQVVTFLHIFVGYR
jgi:hypothetical protein